MIHLIRLKAFCLLVFTPFLVFSQNAAVLENYIQEGLANNAALKTAQFDVERSLNALEQAKTLFMPQVNFQMQYTLAAGGRSQSLPIGDLLNPVYGTLNQITQSNKFPTIENQSIRFLPNNFHDTKIHAVYPIINREIFYNREIRKELISVEQAKIQVYKRELVKNIKTAYIQYLQAQQAVNIYKNALGLVRETERLNQKMVKNQVATPAIVLQAQAEVAKVENSVVETENQAKNAAAYFNFLLNKPLESDIVVDSTLVNALMDTNTFTFGQNLLQKQDNLLQKREELTQIRGGERVLSLQKQMNESYKTPKIGSFIDMGFQGFGFKVWDKQAYALAGIQLELPLYTAGNSKLKIQQTQIELQKVAAQRDEVMQQMQLQTQLAQTNLATTLKTLTVNEAEVTAAREYYRLTERRAREGQVLQIELNDARTQMTNAELKQSLARYTVWLKMVELERATGSYELK